MLLELIPFVCGAGWYLMSGPARGRVLAGSLLIGTAVAAATGELGPAQPLPLLAVLADSTAAVAGWFMARLAVPPGARAG